jgi:class 3 adenylate cyclase
MARPTAGEIRSLVVIFAIFFTVTSAGQYFFVKRQTDNTVSNQLGNWTQELNQAVEYKGGIDLKAYNQALIGVADYFIVISNGSVLDISSTSRGLITGLIPEVSCPLITDAAYSHPVRVVNEVVPGSKETWWLFAKKLDQGIAVLAISEFDDVNSPEKKLTENIKIFGNTLEEARHVKFKALENTISAWAVIDNNGQLVAGWGRVPLKTDPMAMGRIPFGVQERNINKKLYLVLYSPLRDSAGKPVGTIVVPQETTFEREALDNQLLFNTVVGGFSFLVFLALSIFYSTKHEKEKRAIQERFQYYFSPPILEAILRDPTLLEGKRREVTILFSDIRSFTSLSEKTPPQQLTRMLQEYFTAMTEEVAATEGVVDKYIGDAIMAFWGAPVEQPDQADRAVRTAINMTKRLEKLREKWLAGGYPVFHAGIGINLGIATVGNIGSSKRYDYTLIGDAVNAASRIEELNKDFKTRIIISESTKEQLTTPVRTKDRGEVRVKGKEKPIRVFEVDCD